MPGFLYSTLKLNEVTLVGQSLCACVLGALRLQSFISLSGWIVYISDYVFGVVCLARPSGERYF